MNFRHLVLLLQICSYMETRTSARPHYGTKLQTKLDKSEKRSSQTLYPDDKIRKPRKTFLFKKQKWPQPTGENFLKRVRKITKLPTTSTHCKIFCRSGYHLQILPNGVVKGTVDQDSKYGKSERVDDSGAPNELFRHIAFRDADTAIRLSDYN